MELTGESVDVAPLDGCVRSCSARNFERKRGRLSIQNSMVLSVQEIRSGEREESFPKNTVLGIFSFVNNHAYTVAEVDDEER